MKSTTKKESKAKSGISPDIKKWHDKVAAAKKAVEKSLDAYQQEGIQYQTALKEADSKMVLLERLAALKIARFSFKIKNTEYKLAKAVLKLAKKDLKKAEKALPKPATKTTRSTPKSTPKKAQK